MTDAVDSALVLAMPRRELYKVSGFSRRVDLAVLESLDDEHWFAMPETLRGNPDAKEVRIGLVVTRPDAAGEHLLIDSQGVLLHAAPIPPDVARFGTGVRALRDLARAAAAALTGTIQPVVELVGQLNDDALLEAREAFVLVYRVVLAADAAAPTDTVWISRARLKDVPLDPVSALVAQNW
jgi:hypothetical protein